MDNLLDHKQKIEEAIERNKQVAVLQSTPGYKQLHKYISDKSTSYLKSLGTSSDLQEIYHNQGAYNALQSVIQALDEIPNELEVLTKELEYITAEIAENQKYGIAV